MIDPVMAEDGNTYERSAILEWLKSNNKSPLNPSQILDPDRLVCNRTLLGIIEELVTSENIDDDVRKEWCARKRNSDLKKAQQLFDEGNVLEAAKLGLRGAQGLMAQNYWSGKNGFEEDLDTCVKFAKLAAEKEDCLGQLVLGSCYFYGRGVEKDFAAALNWFTLAAEQGCMRSTASIGSIYEVGGYGVAKNFRIAYGWFKKAADDGFDEAQYDLAIMYYKGLGVAKDLAMARSWFKKSADQGDERAQRRLGIMMATGEGGVTMFSQGVALVETAAGQGDSAAVELMKTLTQSLFDVSVNQCD
jgi:TPR repeat protein